MNHSVSHSTRFIQATCLSLAIAALPLVSSATEPQSINANHSSQTISAQETNAAKLQTAIEGAWRTEANVARDIWRHPIQVLNFFDVQPQHTVVEITPGAGWYAEILAPYLREEGHYIAAVVDPQTLAADAPGRTYQVRAFDELKAKFAQGPAQFDRAKVVAYDPAKPTFGSAASADVVLTFRNVHNWRAAGQAENMFAAFFEVLKPGGVLGVVEHRAKADVPEDDRSGYVGQAQMIALAEAAGFVLDASSDINNNPRDTKDHPNGVWMLPPSNKHEASQAATFQAIGESDRMTLRFIKPTE